MYIYFWCFAQTTQIWRSQCKQWASMTQDANTETTMTLPVFPLGATASLEQPKTVALETRDSDEESDVVAKVSHDEVNHLIQLHLSLGYNTRC